MCWPQKLPIPQHRVGGTAVPGGLSQYSVVCDPQRVWIAAAWPEWESYGSCRSLNFFWHKTLVIFFLISTGQRTEVCLQDMFT